MVGGRGLLGLVPFEDCTPQEISQIAAMVHRRLVPAGTTLIDADQPSDGLLLVMSGALRVVDERGLDGTLGPGDVVGELSALGGVPTTATVTATEPSEIVTIAPGHVPALLAMPSVAQRLRAIAEARARSRIERPGTVVTAASVPVMVAPPRIRGRGAGLQQAPARPVRSIVLGLLVLFVAAGSIWFVTERNRATVVTADDLLALAQSEGGFGPSSDAPDGPPAAASAAEALADAPIDTAADADPAAVTGTTDDPTATTDAQPDGGASTSPDQATSDPPPAQPEGSSAPGSPPTEPPPPGSTTARFRPPAPGIYTYDTSGSERISIAGASHTYPEESHMVLRTSSGCGWTTEHHVIEEHVDRREYCSSPSQITTIRFETEVEFFGQKDGLLYVCDPPAVTFDGRPAGTTGQGRCTTDDGESNVDYTGVFVGYEVLDVGGRAVETVHLEIEFTMTGAARGDATLSLWLEPDTGLTVHLERTTDTRTASVWGDVRYQEEATFHLQSMTPRT